MHQEQHQNRHADLLVMVGPSGAGKSTLITKLQKEFPKNYGYSISHTTRDMRTGEQDGVNYHFVDMATFESLLAENQFIEHAKVHNTMYGTSLKSIEDVLNKNQVACMDIDIVGAQNYRKMTNLNATIVFIRPPSLEVLEERLRARGTETEEKLKVRLASAKKEIEWFESHKEFFDAHFLNDDFDTCYKAFRETVMGLCFDAPEANTR